MSHVLEINDAATLRQHQLLWESLLRKTRRATFFHSLAWLRCYWRHYGADQRLRTLVVHSGGEPVGILPLVVRTDRTPLGALRRLTYPLHGWGSFYGPIGPNPTATLLAGLRHIRQTRRDWDVVDLAWIAPDGKRTLTALDQVGLRPHESVCETIAQVDCTQSWDDYWASRKSHWRTNVRRNRRRLEEQGALSFERYRPAGAACGESDPRWDLWECCLQLAEASWQHGSHAGTTLSRAEVRPFLADVHEAAAHAGALDVNLLRLDGQPIAFAYNYVYDGAVYGLRTGYDPAFGNGAGSVLLQHALHDSMTRGDALYDLGAEYLDGKRHWWTQLVESRRYLHYPPGVLKAQALRWAHWLRDCKNGLRRRPTEAQPKSKPRAAAAVANSR